MKSAKFYTIIITLLDEVNKLLYNDYHVANSYDEAREYRNNYYKNAYNGNAAIINVEIHKGVVNN